MTIRQRFQALTFVPHHVKLVLILTNIMIFLFWGIACSETRTCQEIIDQGDAAFNRRADPEQARLAEQKYHQAIQSCAPSSEAYWKLSLVLNWLGRNAPSDQKATFYEQAVEAARKAVEIAPHLPASHYWLGVNLGELAQAKGVLAGLALVDSIKKEMTTVLKMDPNFDSGGANIVLGRLYFRLPTLMGGNLDLAEQYLDKAVNLAPQRYIAYNFLAEVYLAKGKRSEAVALLKQAIIGSCKPEEEPNCRLWKADSEALLRKTEKSKP